jgi:hypothetical protein
MHLYIGYELMPHVSHALIFWNDTQAFRLDEGLTVCPMTIGYGSDAWNTQLISECLLGNGGHTSLNHFSQCLYIVFTKAVTRQILDSFEIKYTYSCSLNEGLMVCPMTTDYGSDAWNT